MTLCPIALAVGCQKCPALKICPFKGVLGDKPKAASEVASPEARVARPAPAKKMIRPKLARAKPQKSPSRQSPPRSQRRRKRRRKKLPIKRPSRLPRQAPRSKSNTGTRLFNQPGRRARLLLHDFQQLDFKSQRRVGGDDAGNAAAAISQIGRANQLRFAAHLHRLHPLRPTGNDAAERESRWL